MTDDLALAGIEPILVPDISAWSPAPDVSAPFVSCCGYGAVGRRRDAATLTIANAQQVDGNFVIGQYTPLDIDVIAPRGTPDLRGPGHRRSALRQADVRPGWRHRLGP